MDEIHIDSDEVRRVKLALGYIDSITNELRSINAKLRFFVVLVVIAILVQACTALLH